MKIAALERNSEITWSVSSQRMKQTPLYKHKPMATAGELFYDCLIPASRIPSVGQKTPPFAGAKRRGRNREEADIPSEINLPNPTCQCFFCKFVQMSGCSIQETIY